MTKQACSQDTAVVQGGYCTRAVVPRAVVARLARLARDQLFPIARELLRPHRSLLGYPQEGHQSVKQEGGLPCVTLFYAVAVTPT